MLRIASPSLGAATCRSRRIKGRAFANSFQTAKTNTPPGISGSSRLSRKNVIVAAASAQQVSYLQPGVKLLGVPLTIPSNIYIVLEVVVLLVQLAMVDAAYSGDWSRIGVITTDTELLLQKVVTFIAVAHIVVGALTGILASKKGFQPLPAAAKGLLFGSMELYAIWQAEPAAERRD